MMPSREVRHHILLLLLLGVPTRANNVKDGQLPLEETLLQAIAVPSVAACDVLVDTKNYDHELTTVLMERSRGVVQHSNLATADLNGTDLSADCLVVAANVATTKGSCVVTEIAEKTFDVGHKKTVLVLVSRNRDDAMTGCDLGGLADMGYRIVRLKGAGNGLFETAVYSEDSPETFKARHVKKHLGGKHLLVSIIGMRPYATYKPMGGTDVSAIDTLAKKFGFEYTLRRERAYGIYQMKNGTYDGLVYQVGTRQTDIGIGQQHMRHKRYQLVDYLPHMYDFALVMMSAQPMEVPLYENLYLPFGMYVWIFFFVSLLAIPPAYALIERENSGRPVYEGVLLALSFINEGAIPQTWLNRPSYASKRILVAFWLLSLFVLMNAYRGNLHAMVISISYEKHIDTIKDFLDSGKTYHILLGASPYHLFKDSGNPDYRAVFDRAEFYHLENGRKPKRIMKELEDGEVVVSGDPIQALITSYHLGSEVLMRSYAAWCLPKGSPLKPVLWRSVRGFTDSGMLHKFKRDEVSKARVPRPRIRTARPLEIRDLATTFLLWLAAVACALVAYGIEAACGSRKNNKAKNRTKTVATAVAGSNITMPPNAASSKREDIISMEVKAFVEKEAEK